MGLRLVMTRTRDGNRIMRKALNAANTRAHRQLHNNIATDMRKQADHIEAQIEEVKTQVLDLTQTSEEERHEWLEQAEKHVLHLRTGAMEQENATCLDEH